VELHLEKQEKERKIWELGHRRGRGGLGDAIEAGGKREGKVGGGRGRGWADGVEAFAGRSTFGSTKVNFHKIQRMGGKLYEKREEMQESERTQGTKSLLHLMGE